jgi:hypothetical protein
MIAPHRMEKGTVHTNRFAKLIDSYRLATKEPPPVGHILVHNKVEHTSSTQQDTRGSRAWVGDAGRRVRGLRLRMAARSREASSCRKALLFRGAPASQV